MAHIQATETKMDILKEYWAIISFALVNIVTFTVFWTRIIDKVNGQGARIDDNKSGIAKLEGRVDRMDKEMFEYRRDAQDATKGLARVEKGIESLHTDILQGNLQLGSQLHEIERKNDDKDVRNQVRLTRIETVVKIEDKLGPLSSD